MWARLVVAACVALGAQSAAPATSPDFVPFFIVADTAGEALATAWAAGAGAGGAEAGGVGADAAVTCRFAFAPDDGTVAAERKEEAAARRALKLQRRAAADAEALVSARHPAALLAAALSGQCATYEAAGFVYTLCIGRELRQRAQGAAPGSASDFSLGKFDERDAQSRRNELPAAAADVDQERVAARLGPQTQLFRDGDQCGLVARRGALSLHCGQTFQCVAASEPEVCAYSFAVAHPSLCARRDLFPEYSPLAPAQQQQAQQQQLAQMRAGAGGRGRGRGGVAFSDVGPPPVPPPPADANERARMLVRALPAEARSALKGEAATLALARALELQDAELAAWEGAEGVAGGEGAAAAAPAANPASHGGEALAEHALGLPLTDADVAGVGGKTIGSDDHERHGGRWTGLREGAGAGGAAPGEKATASWALDLHASWPALALPAATAGGKGARWRQSWTCAALGTDDLRKGTSSSAFGGGSAPAPAHRVSLELRVAGARAGAVSAVAAAEARGSNRDSLAPTLQHSADAARGTHAAVLSLRASPPDGGGSGGSGGDEDEDEDEADFGEDGNGGGAGGLDVAFMSVTMTLEGGGEE